jgi:surface protein
MKLFFVLHAFLTTLDSIPVATKPIIGDTLAVINGLNEVRDEVIKGNENFEKNDLDVISGRPPKLMQEIKRNHIKVADFILASTGLKHISPSKSLMQLSEKELQQLSKSSIVQRFHKLLSEANQWHNSKNNIVKRANIDNSRVLSMKRNIQACSANGFTFNICANCCGYRFGSKSDLFTAISGYPGNIANYGAMQCWDVSSVTDMSQLFHLNNFMNEPIGCWNVSSVTNMDLMFAYASSFNQPLDNWDVSSVTDMGNMFEAANSFNQPLRSWDVSKVRVVYAMFYLSSFNQPLADWNVSSVTVMTDMFKEASRFNQSLCEWYNKLQATATVDAMFFNSACARRVDPNFTTKESFCQQCVAAPAPAPAPAPRNPLPAPAPPTIPAPASLGLLPKPSVPAPKTMETVPKPSVPVPKPTIPAQKPFAPVPKPTKPAQKPFEPVPKPTKPAQKPFLPLPKPKVSTPTFAETAPKPVLPVSKPSASVPKPIKPPQKLFSPEPQPKVPVPTSIETVPKSVLPVPKPAAPVPRLSCSTIGFSFNICANCCGYKFGSKSDLFTAISGYPGNIATYGAMQCWDVSFVTDMSQLFHLNNFMNEPIGCWNVSSTTNMDLMFAYASSFNQPLDNWDVSSVTDMGNMFEATSKFNQPLRSWDVSQVRVMYAMFYLSSFNQPLADWNVSSVTVMTDMFKEASRFNQSLCQWYNKLQTTATVDAMFINSGCPKKLDPNFSTKESFCQQCTLAPVPAPTKFVPTPTLPVLKPLEPVLEPLPQPAARPPTRTLRPRFG